MKKSCLTLLILLSCLAQVGLAQTGTVIEKAMKDELNRSMTELKLDTLAKPFYISYIVDDLRTTTIFGSLGGIITTVDVPIRNKGVRVLVGDYEMNDESLDNNLFSSPEASEIALPLDDDYLGIRRAFWSTTDNVYKNAARQHAKNKSDFIELKKELKDVPHRTFAKVPVVQFSVPSPTYTFSQDKWEDVVRTLSALFVGRDLETSRVGFSFNRGRHYFINSEGTTIQTPVHKASLLIVAQTRTSEGNMIFDQLEFHHETPAQLPETSVLIKEVERFIDRLEKAKSGHPFEEEYSGPVLLTGRAVADVLPKILFFGRERLIADNALPNANGLRGDRGATELKPGKSITSASLTVKAVSKMESFNGTALLGSFKADREGVVPPDEVILIENGIFQNHLNDRTLTNASQQANGHNDGPGVVSISISNSMSEAELKKNLIEKAKQDGLDYAVIIREGSFGPGGIYNVYRVSVETGEEELQHSALLQGLSMKALKKILGGTKEVTAHNVSFNGLQGMSSYIVPQAVLLGEVELHPGNLRFQQQEEQFVESPLKKKP